MKMKYKIFLLILVMITSLIGFVSGDYYNLGIFKQGEDVEIPQPCNTCTYGYLTGVWSPNGTLLVSSGNFTQTSSTMWTYTLLGGNTTELGTYKYCIDFGNGVDVVSGCVDFDISYSGIELSTAQSMLYLGLLLICVLLLVGSVMLMGKLPSGNVSDENGEIIQINNLKYLKYTLFIIAYLLTFTITFLASNISYAYLQESLFGRLFFVMYIILGRLMIPMFIVMICWFLVKVVQDKKLKKYIEGGLFK